MDLIGWDATICMKGIKEKVQGFTVVKHVFCVFLQGRLFRTEQNTSHEQQSNQNQLKHENSFKIISNTELMK